MTDTIDISPATVAAMLEGVTPGPWSTDEGGEVHASGSTIFAWPNFVDQENPQIWKNMEFAAWAREAVPALVARLAEVDRWVKIERMKR